MTMHEVRRTKDEGRIKGFTLIEIMSVIAIIGILLSVISPSLFGRIRRQRLEGNIQQLAYAIKKTRIEAMSEGTRTVVLVVTGTSTDFDNDGEKEHYLSFLDNDKSGTFTTGASDKVLYRADWGDDIVVSTNTLTPSSFYPNTGQIIFFPQGTMAEITGTQEVRIKEEKHSSEYSLELLSITGMVRVRRVHL